MKDRLRDIVRDVRSSTWHFRLFSVGLPLFMWLSSSDNPGHFGPKLPELSLGFLSFGGGQLGDLLLTVFFFGMLTLWLTDSRRHYRINRDTLYLLLFPVYILVISLLNIIFGHAPLFKYEHLPNGGFSLEASGIFFVLYLIIAYAISWPFISYFEKRHKTVKGIDSKKIFK